MSTHVVTSNLGNESYSLRNMYLSVFVVKTTYMYVGMMLAWAFLSIPHLETSLPIFMLDKAAILASLPLGMALGPFAGSILAPRFGFESIFLLFGCLSLASVLLLAFHQVLVVCLAGLAAGVAIGAVLCYADAYFRDISDQEVRTTFSPLTLAFLTLGFYLVYDIGQILSYFEMLLILLIVPLVLLVVSLTWLPESPYFYVDVGNLEKAKKSVDFLHRGISTRGLDNLMLLIQEDMRRRENGNDLFILPYLKNPKVARVSLAFFTLLPLTGFPVVFVLMGPLIRNAQQEVAVSSSLAAVAKIGLFLNLVTWALHPYCSSRLKMTISSAIMSLSMVAFGVFFFLLESHQDVSSVTWVPLLCTAFYTAAFLVGFVYKHDDGASTLSRQQTCGRVFALSSGFSSMFLVVLLFLPIQAALGTAPILWAFSAFSILLTIFIRIYSPEVTLF